ncbi:MAG: Gfo/Idh/MocA family oxidoreductase [Lentisphaerae bacterium]|nr:Gfo/Idh/MocA family oxidoreductase [Lentisphaerota bacterium]
MVKCGVIGCGVIAPTHIAGIEAVPNAELVALCDIDPERLNKRGDEYNVDNRKRYTDYRDLLADREIDLVHVCTDHASHCQIVVDALNAGKHVICEKSSGRVDADLEAMANAAKAHPELVSSGIFQHRFVKQNCALKELVENSKFGKMVLVNLSFCCKRTNEYYQADAWRGTMAGEGGGILINQAIHHLDQLRFIFGDIDYVTAASGNLTHQGVIEVEDTAAFTMEFASGVLGSVSATNSSNTRWRSSLICSGTDATLEFANEQPIYVDAADETLKSEIETLLAPPAKEERIVGKSYYGTGHTAQIADVVDSIENKRAPKVSLIEAINSSSLIMAVYESARNNGARTAVRKY